MERKCQQGFHPGGANSEQNHNRERVPGQRGVVELNYLLPGQLLLSSGIKTDSFPDRVLPVDPHPQVETADEDVEEKVEVGHPFRKRL